MSKSGYVFLFFLLFVMLLGFTESDSRLAKQKENVIKKKELPLLESGDIVFQASLSDQSKAIQLATKSKYSHVGMVHKKSGKLFVLEAVQPVKLTPLKEWIERGEGKHYVVKRLKKREGIDFQEKLNSAEKKWVGKDYDAYFEWTDDKIYCSELVWKIYKEAIGVELSPLQSFNDLALNHPLVKSKLKERFGNNIPLTEKIISPKQLYNSSLLELVYQN